MDDSERLCRQRGLRRAVLAGDEDAWRTLYVQHYASLYQYVHARAGRQSHVSDELVQEVWLHAVRQIGRFDPARGSFAAWLTGIAANVLRNHYRRPRPLCLSDEPATEPEMRSADETSDAVGRAMLDLPADYQRVLREKYALERPVVEIARGWNRTPKSVESLLSRARAAFRAAYRRLSGDNQP